jgi:hypothetical protein
MSEDPTQITLRTVLEAVNEVSVELRQFRAEVEKRFERLEAAMSEGFDDLDKRMAVLAGDVIKVRSAGLMVNTPGTPARTTSRKPSAKKRA